MKRLRAVLILIGCFAALLFTAPVWNGAPAEVVAASSTSTRFPSFGYILDNPTLTIAGATMTTAPTSIAGVSSAQVQWAFGTVSGSYSGCSVQAKTSIDGANWLTLGSAASVTVTSNTVNAWGIFQQAPTTSGVTVTTASSSTATAFADQIEYTFACSGYGTSAPVTIKAIYK
jgi:hypothetical protein